MLHLQAPAASAGGRCSGKDYQRPGPRSVLLCRHAAASAAVHRDRLQRCAAAASTNPFEAAAPSSASRSPAVAVGAEPATATTSSGTASDPPAGWSQHKWKWNGYTINYLVRLPACPAGRSTCVAVLVVPVVCGAKQKGGDKARKAPAQCWRRLQAACLSGVCHTACVAILC